MIEEDVTDTASAIQFYQQEIERATEEWMYNELTREHLNYLMLRDPTPIERDEMNARFNEKRKVVSEYIEQCKTKLEELQTK